MKFPTSTADGHTPAQRRGISFSAASLASLRLKGFALKPSEELTPRVLVETPSPPASLKRRIGKETLAGARSVVADFPRNLHSAVRIQRVSSCAERL